MGLAGIGAGCLRLVLPAVVLAASAETEAGCPALFTVGLLLKIDAWAIRSHAVGENATPLGNKCVRKVLI